MRIVKSDGQEFSSRKSNGLKNSVEKDDDRQMIVDLIRVFQGLVNEKIINDFYVVEYNV